MKKPQYTLDLQRLYCLAQHCSLGDESEEGKRLRVQDKIREDRCDAKTKSQAIPSPRESQLCTGGPALHYCLSVSPQVLFGKGIPGHHTKCLYHIRCSALFTIIIS